MDESRMDRTLWDHDSAEMPEDQREMAWDDMGGPIEDALPRVASSSPDVIKWFRMQGRSYGVVPIFATQEPEQLKDDVRSVMFSLSTAMSYAQNNSKVAEEDLDPLAS